MTGDTDRLSDAKGFPVVGADGARLGDVDALYEAKDTGEIEWIAVGTGFIATRRVLVPAADAIVAEGQVRVPYDEAMLKSAPEVEGDEFDAATERRLYAHYGIDATVREAELASEADTVVAPAVRDETATMIAAEEELHVDTEEVDAGKVRLRKFVETEPVRIDVELRHDRVHVRREAVGETVSGVELADAEVEVVLRVEEPVVEKRVVAKERITLEKDVEVERTTISDSLRRERIEVEGPDGERA